MTEDAVRERLAALEVELRYLRASQEEMRTAVSELRDILTQAKGARWFVLGAIGIGAFLAGKAPTLLAYLGSLAPK